MEVAAFGRWPLREVPLYSQGKMHTYVNGIHMFPVGIYIYI